VTTEVIKRCDCGGEVQLEYFDPMKRPVEWFMRCRQCCAMSDPVATQEQAITAWNTKAAE